MTAKVFGLLLMIVSVYGLYIVIHGGLRIYNTEKWKKYVEEIEGFGYDISQDLDYVFLAYSKDETSFILIECVDNQVMARLYNVFPMMESGDYERIKKIVAYKAKRMQKDLKRVLRRKKWYE